MKQTKLAEAIKEMVRRDIFRAAQCVAGQRPGDKIEDGKRCWVLIPISPEAWEQVYGEAPPDRVLRTEKDGMALAGCVVVKAFLRYHLGKRSFELEYWAVVDDLEEALSEPSYMPWGVGEMQWKDLG
jgi:hypothetical protein